MNIKNKIWFTGDQHFFHKNIIRFCNRPFKNVNDMNETIINNWNNVVGKNDIVYNLGDISIGRQKEVVSILEQLNGRKVLIVGNHDEKVNRIADKFEGVYYYLELKEYNIVLSHYPFLTWNRIYHNSIHLHGHSHGTLKDVYNEKGEIITNKRFDVGVDCNNFTPFSLEQVFSMAAKFENNPIDHR